MKMHEILQQDQDIWDLFTRKEEYTNPLRDQYGRFPYYASRNRDIFEPRVSQYLVEHGYQVNYPDDAPFAVCLTHDIDAIYQSIASKGLNAYHLFKQGNSPGALKKLFQMRSRKLPFFNFSSIMDLEEKYGAKSTFFFKADRPGDQEYTYNIEDVETEVGAIIDRGWEVGLHGGHSTYLNPGEMKEKRERLEKVTGKPVIGYRNHYLRFLVPETWEYLSQAGFRYDSTLGYADCAGFRNGMCHPFRPFNLNMGKEIDILEIPLVVMDRTLDSYMRMDTKIGWEVIQKLIDTVEKCHGIFTILWHNAYTVGENFKLYEKVLQYCDEKKAWMTNGEEIEKRCEMNE